MTREVLEIAAKAIRVGITTDEIGKQTDINILHFTYNTHYIKF
jgi:hypothetical protein